METSVAFDGLMQMINVIGSFINAPIWFGLSVMNILVITFVFHYAIGIILGGITSRPNISSTEIKKEEKE